MALRAVVDELLFVAAAAAAAAEAAVVSVVGKMVFCSSPDSKGEYLNSGQDDKSYFYHDKIFNNTIEKKNFIGILSFL